MKLQLAPEPLTRGLLPQDPCPLSSTEFVETPPPLNKIPGYTTVLEDLYLQYSTIYAQGLHC